MSFFKSFQETSCLPALRNRWIKKKKEIDGLVNLTCYNTYAVGWTNIIYYLHHFIQIWKSPAQCQVPLDVHGSVLLVFCRKGALYKDPVLILRLQIHSPLKPTQKSVSRRTSGGLFSWCQSFEEKDLKHGDGIQSILDFGPFKTSGLWGESSDHRVVFSWTKLCWKGQKNFWTLVRMAIIVQISSQWNICEAFFEWSEWFQDDFSSRVISFYQI